MAKPIHIAVISIPAFSHQASIIEFSKKLIHHYNHFHITCIFPTIDSPLQTTLTLLKSLPPSITYTFLPPISKTNLPQNLSPAVQIQIAVSKSMPSFHTTISSLCSSSTTNTKPPLFAIISDPFANESLELAKEFNLLSYIYFPPSAMTLSLFIQFPKLHQEVTSEFRDHNEAIQIPGCIPIHGSDLPEHFQDRSSLAYDLILQRCKRFNLADGFLVNSFMKMEEKTLKALEENNNFGSVFLVGPIIQNGSESNLDSECLKWLRNQNPNSVLYVSFGSGGTLSQEQINELAFGLELSAQKFLWVLRVPSDSSNESYLGPKNEDHPLNFLPKGFLERTQGQGLVVPNWAPQTQILSHGSVGGFLTHCGWNSVLESVVLGVPMIVWPLFAEQKMNSILLCDGVKVGMRLKFNENGLVERDEIGKVVKGFMVGEEGNVIRERIQVLRDDAIDALKDDGSSTRAICEFGERLESFERNI